MGDACATGNKFNMSNVSSSQTIRYNQLVELLKTDISPKRRHTVDAAWNFLNQSNQSCLSLEWLFSQYHPDNHPRVRTR